MSTEYSIMLVDDDEDLLFLLRKQFVQAGLETFVCQNGKGLIKQLIEKKINIVLMDIAMGSVSGQELCTTIRADKRTAGIKILMMSGNLDISQIAATCGADGFVTKPIDMKMVKKWIADLAVDNP